MTPAPTTPAHHHPAEGFDPLAGFLAFLFPGLGHLLRGQAWRAAGAAVGVLGLFFGGLLLGGIDVVDSKEDRIWFVGQALVGPIALGVDRLHQTHFKAFDPDRPNLPPRSGQPDEKRVLEDGRPVWRSLSDDEFAAHAGPPNLKSVAKVNEIGTLSCTLAGMMNLIIILDALLPTLRRRTDAARPVEARA